MAARGAGRRARPGLHAGRGGSRGDAVRGALPPLRGARRTFRHIRPARPNEARHDSRTDGARHDIRHHRPPDGRPYRDPVRLALSLTLVHSVVFGLSISLTGIREQHGARGERELGLTPQSSPRRSRRRAQSVGRRRPVSHLYSRRATPSGTGSNFTPRHLSVKASWEPARWVITLVNFPQSVSKRTTKR
jgi:hypothetical protein